MSTALTIFIVFLFVILTVSAVVLLFFYAAYRATPEFHWKQQVLSREAVIRRRLNVLNSELRGADRRQQSEIEHERTDAFSAYLSSISVDELQSFPGIGPATVDRLRQAGLSNLDRLQVARLNLPGIGPKREQDLRNAIRQLLRDAESRFKSKACREAQELDKRIQSIEAKFDRLIEETQVDIRKNESKSASLDPYVRIARRVSFFKHLLGYEVRGLTEKLLNTAIDEQLNPIRFEDRPPERIQPQDDSRRPVPLVVPERSTDAPVAPIKPASSAPLPSGKTLSAPQIVQKATAPPSAPQKAEPAPIDPFVAAVYADHAKSSSSKPEHPRLPHLRATIAFGFAVAREDGIDMVVARETIRRYVQQKFGHEPELNLWIHPLIERTEGSKPSLDLCVRPMSKLFEPPELQDLFRFACQIAEPMSKRDLRSIKCLELIDSVWLLNALSKPGTPAGPESVRKTITPGCSITSVAAPAIQTPTQQTANIAADPFADSLVVRNGQSRLSTPAHPRKLHLIATVKFAFAVARSDGRVAKSERTIIREYLKRAVGHEPELDCLIDPLMEQTEKNPVPLDECLKPILEMFDAEERGSLYRFACAIADAAGKRNTKEAECLETISAAWGINLPSAAVPPAAAPPPASTSTQEPLTQDDCLAALEIAPGITINADLVRRQYRLLTEKNNPSRFESHGAEFVQLARKRRDLVEQAAKFLLVQWGDKLDEEKKPEVETQMRHNPDLDSVFGK